MNEEMEKFKLVIESTGLSEETLIAGTEKYKSVNGDKLSIIKLNGLALTAKGKITRVEFLNNLKCDREKYDDIILTAEQALALTNTYRRLSTGVNSVVPVTCTAGSCPFKDDCWYFLNDKAPIGRPCLIELDLLEYHTERFMNEFLVDPEDHSEVMLIQELSELIIYEMRASRVLSKSENAHLGGIRLKFSPDGEEIQEETEHWAWNLKEKIKNRRMKIYEALNATRKQTVLTELGEVEDNSFAAMTKKMKDIIDKVNKVTNAAPTEVEEVR